MWFKCQKPIEMLVIKSETPRSGINRLKNKYFHISLDNEILARLKLPTIGSLNKNEIKIDWCAARH